MIQSGNNSRSYSRSRAGSRLAMAILLLATTAAIGAQEIPEFVKPNAEGTSYTIDYEALAAADGLTQAEKYQIARMLRMGDNHAPVAGVEDIAGLGGHCKVKKFLGIPDGVDCTLTASPAATIVLSKLGTFALTNAICLVIDAEDGEITEPICDLLLEGIVESTISPVLEQCAEKDQSTELKFKFQLLPKPKLNANAECK